MSARVSRTRIPGAGDRSFDSFEHLEPRIVFDAPHEFAGVGIRYDNGAQLFYARGAVDANDAISGTMEFANASGSLGTSPIDWTSLVRGPDGSMTLGTRNGFTPYASQTGTQFIVEDRWLRGSFVGRDDQGNTRDFAALAELEDHALSPYFIADFTLTRITQAGELENFTLVVEMAPNAAPGTLYRLTFHLPEGDNVVDAVPSFGTNGEVGFGAYGTLTVPHSANGGSALLFYRDFDDSDGVVAVGLGRMGGDYAEGSAGRFRSVALVDGPLGAAFFGVDPQGVTPGHPEAANVVIELNYWTDSTTQSPASTFRIFRQSEWDSGSRTPIREGTWSYETVDGLRFIRMVDGDGVQVTMRAAASRAIQFNTVSNGTSTEAIQGVGQAIIYREGAPISLTASVDGLDRAVAYIHFATGNDGYEMLSVNLSEEVGGGTVRGPLVTWHSRTYLSSIYYVAGLSSDGDVLVWRMLADGVSWSFTNLTDALDGAIPLTSDLFHTRDATSRLFTVEYPFNTVPLEQVLAGYDNDGNFVVYRWDEGNGEPGGSTWSFENLSADGVDGSPIPAVTGGMSGWAADWGASHFAGVDSNGELWSVWHAPGMARWRVDSLTQSSGGPMLTPALPAAITTRWNAFHISAVDPQGHLIMTWWAPGFTNWVTQDMTADLGGPTLQPGSLTADFNRDLDNINIVGQDAQGRPRIYWWGAQAGWHVSDLSAGIPVQDIPLGPWRITHTRIIGPGVEGWYHTQSLEGRDVQGSFVRLIWSSTGPDAWVLENVTNLSTPYDV